MTKKTNDYWGRLRANENRATGSSLLTSTSQTMHPCGRLGKIQMHDVVQKDHNRLSKRQQLCAAKRA